jgi:hypothetical protein
MKVAIIGSRDFNDYSIIIENLKHYESNIKTVISGGANGADKLAERWAKENNKEIIIFLPDWKKYGKSAGIIRNKDIVENSDIIFAFWDGKSKGTKNSIDYATKLKKEIKIIQ